MSDVLLRLRPLLSRTLRVPQQELLASDPLRRFGIDNLDLLEIVCAVEEEFGIRLSDAEITSFDTVAELASLIDRKRAGVAA